MVKRERIQNNTRTTLNGGINASTTTVTVTDGSIFPSTGNFLVRTEEEIMRVTARSTNDLTVTRGYAGSTAASHGTGLDIFMVIDGDQIEQFFREAGDEKFLNQSSDDWSQQHRILDASGNTLNVSDWTVVTGSTNPVDLGWGGHRMSPSPLAGIRLHQLVHSQPSTPYTITARVAMDNPNDNGSSSNLYGICLRESSSGKIMSLYIRALDRVSMTTWASPTSVNAQIAQIDWGRRLDTWLRFTNDGTTMEGFASCDGHTWLSIGTQSVGTYLTPNQCGWFGANRDTAGHKFFLLSYLEE